VSGNGFFDDSKTIYDSVGITSISGIFSSYAFLISTNDAVFVTFRGTQTGKSITAINNWLGADFDCELISANTNLSPGISGKIHSGYTKSLNLQSFKERLTQKIFDLGGRDASE